MKYLFRGAGLKTFYKECMGSLALLTPRNLQFLRAKKNFHMCYIPLFSCEDKNLFFVSYKTVTSPVDASRQTASTNHDR